MTSSNPTAEIYDMEDARARRRASDEAGEGNRSGAQLAAAREAAGMTLAEAAAKTHIKERHLQAIEDLDIAAMPPRPYALGFVKVYSEFLGLDPEEVLERFKEDADFSVPQKVEVKKFEKAAQSREPGGNELSLAAVIAIIAFFIWCAWQITLLDGRQLASAEGGGLPATEPGGQAVMEPKAAVERHAENVVEARILERVEPVYPIGCLTDAGQAESVSVIFNISNTGRVNGEHIAQSSNDCFDEAALNAVRRWRFDPRTVDGAARPAYDQTASFTFQRPH